MKTVTNTLIKSLSLIIGAIVISACSTTSTTSTDNNTTQCEEPRPQMCTMEYMPVCATLADGSNKTFASGCSACGDSEVKSYTDNEC